MPPFNATHPRNIPSVYFKPIGQIIVRWGFTELYIQSIIWYIWGIEDPKIARALTWNINAVDKVSLFKALSKRWIKDIAVQNEIEAMSIEAERLRCERNKYAHGIWGHRPGNKKDMRIFYLRSIDHRITPRNFHANITEVRKLASDIDALNIRLQKLHSDLGAPLP
jgi:hypothetical protein